MDSLIVNIAALLFLFPIIPFNLKIYEYIWYLPVVIYIGITVYKKKNNYADNCVAQQDVTLSDWYKIFFINFFFFALLCLIIFYLNMITKKYVSWNIPFVIYYFLLIQNIDFPTPGNYFMKIYCDTSSVIQKFKIFILNFCKFLMVYCGLLYEKFQFPKSDAYKSLLEIIALCYIFNFFSRFIIFKNTSILEKILHVKFYKVTNTIVSSSKREEK